jgi:nucleoside-diphosphate-sugar epimerase
MKPIAILGASGFVGVRLVEMHHLGGGAPLRPIFYRPQNLAQTARFQLDWRLADYTNVDALAKALDGCETLVHLATGDPKIILALIEPVYEAAARAGLRRLVFISSAAVHGQTPAPGTTESTPPPHRHQLPYNAAKAQAENRWRAVRARGPVELVILRPGIVWGPRSRWVTEAVRAMRAGTFGWLDSGRGVINPIYVDNLVHAIDRALVAPVDGETFLLNDPQPETWREFFTPWLEACGIAPDNVPDAPAFVPARGCAAWLERVRLHSMTQRVAPAIPGALKRMVKAVAAALPEPPAPDAFRGLNSGAPGPAPLTEEMTLLEHCSWRFPVERAVTKLGWQPKVEWPVAVERTLGWLKFAGQLPQKD